MQNQSPLTKAVLRAFNFALFTVPAVAATVNPFAPSGATPIRFDFSSVSAAVFPAIQAGDPNGTPTDSPALRVDPNTTSSRFAGIGSIWTLVPSGPEAGSYIGTGTPISPYHILTAAHVVDIDGDGSADIAPGNVNFNLNYGSAISHQISAAAITIHPDFTGFANPAINDDLAILTLSSPLPAGVPIYTVAGIPADYYDLTLVGYGRSGDGVAGYTVAPSFSVKRSGLNLLEAIDYDDEQGFDPGSAIEVYAFDFEDSANRAATDEFGIDFAYGNDLETLIGGGDSGGPAFVEDIFGNLFLVGVNTFGYSPITFPPQGKFGEVGGGIWLESYVPWIDSVVPEPSTYAAGGFMILALGTLWLRRRSA